MREFRDSQFATALKLLAVPFFGGGIGYYVLGLLNPKGPWSLLDCFYMSTITLTTVGYGETLDGMSNFPLARVYTMVLLVFGTGLLAYAVSTGTAFIIEGNLAKALERRRMQKAIAALGNHYVVCGAGSTGINVVRELIETGTPFVLVEREERRIEKCREAGCKLYVQGDATSDETLISAGIRTARGLATCLPDDKENLFVIVTARQLNPDLRIVTKNVEKSAAEKLRNAGATATVSPNIIGGLRLASELIRPAVVTFFDIMLHDESANMRIAEVTVEAGSQIDGKTLGEANIPGRIGVPVLAVRSQGESNFRYNPTSDVPARSGGGDDRDGRARAGAGVGEDLQELVSRESRGGEPSFLGVLPSRLVLATPISYLATRDYPVTNAWRPTDARLRGRSRRRPRESRGPSL